MGKKIKGKKEKKQPMILQIKEFHRKIKVKIPPELVSTALKMDKLVDTEWMLMTKVKEYKEGEIILSDEYYIPEQEATGGSVNPKEFPKEYSVVIHRHPDGVMSFSGTDWEFLNQSFPISLLWVDRKFVEGVMQVETPAGMTWINLELEMDIPEEFNKLIKKKVKNPTPKYTRQTTYGRYGSYGAYRYPQIDDVSERVEEFNNVYASGAGIIAELMAKNPNMDPTEVQDELERRGIFLTIEEIERMMFGY